MDSTNLFSHTSGFLDLLNSQQEFPVFSSQWSDDPIQVEDTPEDRRGRRKWSPKEDVVLISAWLNTSKDPVIGNEQKAEAFCKRIAAYFNSSPKVAGLPKREASHCKQRWGKINVQVCKFVGCLEAANSQKSSGENENDVMKFANQIYFNDNKVKFTLEHAWRELRHDQKWCASTSITDNDNSKRRKCEEGSQASGQSSSSYTVSHGDEAMARPPGVKASKAKGKKTTTVEVSANSANDLLVFQNMWDIKKQDMTMKLLDSLLAKTEPLSDIEMALKNKLITDMLSNA